MLISCISPGLPKRPKTLLSQPWLFWPISLPMVCQSTTYTVCIKDIEYLNLIWLFEFMLKPTFATALAFSKNITHFKSNQKWPKNNQLASFTKVKSKLYTTCHELCLWTIWQERGTTDKENKLFFQCLYFAQKVDEFAAALWQEKLFWTSFKFCQSFWAGLQLLMTSLTEEIICLFQFTTPFPCSSNNSTNNDSNNNTTNNTFSFLQLSLSMPPLTCEKSSNNINCNNNNSRNYDDSVLSSSLLFHFSHIRHFDSSHMRNKRSISSTCVCATFTPIDPKSAKSCLSWLSFLRVWDLCA